MRDKLIITQRSFVPFVFFCENQAADFFRHSEFDIRHSPAILGS